MFQKPFFRKFRHFAMYNVSPYGEILPFGDGEQKIVASRGDELYSILFFHALRYQDPVTRWWIDLLPQNEVEPDRLGVLHRLLLPDNLSSSPPEQLPLDRAFHGVGWSVFHGGLRDRRVPSARQYRSRIGVSRISSPGRFRTT